MKFQLISYTLNILCLINRMTIDKLIALKIHLWHSYDVLYTIPQQYYTCHGRYSTVMVRCILCKFFCILPTATVFKPVQLSCMTVKILLAELNLLENYIVIRKYLNSIHFIQLFKYLNIITPLNQCQLVNTILFFFCF